MIKGEKAFELRPLKWQRSKFARKFFLQVHKTIGLFAGAIFVLIGLRGSILSFREDIDEWLNAPLRVNVPSAAGLSVAGRNSRSRNRRDAL
jgi:uncharacterized iron-regulated membrane protein